ncbi:MAG: hypothetical protein ACKVOJ_10680 [Sphingomonadaceae bacterium]
MASWAWETLGIERTDDVAAVRRAYAAKLKALDLDRDVQAYGELRGARDEALWQARNFDVRDIDDFDPFADEYEDADEDSAPIEESYNTPVFDTPVFDAPVFEASEDDEWQTETAATADPHEQAIHEVLFDADPETPLTPDEQAKAAGHVAALLANPKLELIDDAEQVENWLAFVLAQSTPRSDPVIDAVADHFGWAARKDEINLPWTIAHVTQRIALRQFIEKVQVKGTRYYPVWCELTNTRPILPSWSVSKSEVTGFLTQLRERFPEAEAMLDPARVAKWDAKVSGPSRSVWTWGWAFFVVIQILLAIGRCTGNSYEPKPPPVVSIPVEKQSDTGALRNLSDIQRALEPLFGTDLTMAKITKQQPPLALALADAWRTSQKRGDNFGMFREALAQLLGKRESAGIRMSGRTLIIDRRRDELDILTGLTPTECATYINTGDYPRPLPDDLRQRRIKLAARTLLETSAAPDSGDGTNRFSVSAAVVRDVVKRSGMPFAQIKIALAGKGSDAQLCKARIALLEAALGNREKDALTLLREM